MARKIIDIGTVGNDGTGDSIRDSFRKVNDNFRELYSSLGLGEKLTFINMDDTPLSYVGQYDTVTGSTPVVTVKSTEDGVDFKHIRPGVGTSINYSDTEIIINSEFSSLVGDTDPKLGGNLSARSGGVQYRIVDLGTTASPLDPIYQHEAVNKDYADSKISLAGVDAIDPAIGIKNPAFGQMTGPLILSRDPQPEDDTIYDGLVAATKRYVDNSAFGSSVNLYVATSGQDDRVGVSKSLQGRALAYAYRTLEAALKRAEELILESRKEIGPYKKLLTYNGGAGICTLADIDTAPASGSGFSGSIYMSVDGITLNAPGVNYEVGDIITISGGTYLEPARYQVLSVGALPGTSKGPVLTFRQLSSGVYSVLPGSTGIASTVTTSSGGFSFGSGATFDLTYKVNSATVDSGGSGYGLVSVRISGGGGSGAFGFADVVGGVIQSITITDGGTGFTSLPTLIVDLPRFLIKTEGYRTDFTGDVTTDTPLAVRSRDIREGLYLRGEESGALAQILAHDGSLDSSGNEIMDVDILYGSFQLNEPISYGDQTKTTQITVLVESGIYEENLPLRVPQNVSIVGDEFRRCIIRPRAGVTSSSPWAFLYFRRDTEIDGLTVADREYGYHYLQDSSQPVYPLINNKGYYRAAAQLIELNREFVQQEVVEWINDQVTNEIAPFDASFTYNDDLCKRDIGLILDSMVFDLRYGGSARTISAALKYYQNASGLIAITTQKSETIAAIQRVQILLQMIIKNIPVTELYSTVIPQIIDGAYISETGVGGTTVNISGITTAATAVITTATPHSLTTGQRIIIADVGGMVEVNGNDWYVTVLDASNFTIHNLPDRSDNIDSTSFGSYTSGGTVTTEGGVLGALFDAFIDVIDGSGSVNYPKENDQMDVFLANDAVRWQAITIQGQGGFALVLDPEGQILAKSPYAQECASFSKSTGRHTFAGGMFVDGFAGNIRFEITSKDSDTRLRVGRLPRFPQLPASFIVNDSVYRINYVRDYVYSPSGSTALFVLDETTPWPFDLFSYNPDICSRDVGLIIDGLYYDIILETNYNARKAALSYRQANAAVVINDQLDLTVRAIREAHNLATDVVTGTYDSVITGISSSSTTFTNIVQNGATFAPTLVLTDPPGLSSARSAAKTQLINNLEFIKNETIEWIEAQIGDTNAPFSSGFNYDSAKCARDVGYIIEAVAYDITYGGNSATRDAARRYYDGVGDAIALQLDAGQEEETAAAIDYASTVAQAVIQNLDPATIYGTISRVSGTASDSATATIISNLMADISAVVTGGIGSLPTETLPDVDAYAYNATYKSGAAAVLAAKSTIQTGVIDYVDDNANVYEVLMPGNRSMLSNDYTQINDMGYGVIGTNGGLVEAVSMFTYYCYISYYSLNGAQIRSVGGSSAHGVYALVAEGVDPLEVPTPVNLLHDMSQGATVYNDGGTYANAAGDLQIYVTNYTYPPLNNSELEINHSGVIFRYPVTTAQELVDLPGVTKLSLQSSQSVGVDGLYALVPNGTKVTIRNNTQVVLTGDVVNVTTRPSTGLILRESPVDVYRILQFEEYIDPKGNQEVTIVFGNPTVFYRDDHGLFPGYQIQFTSTGVLPAGLLTDTVYYVSSDGFTSNQFRLSTTKGGNLVITTDAGTGTHYFSQYGLARTTLREGYNYVDLTIWPTQPFRTSGAVCTIAVGDPAVITLASHGFNPGDVIRFETDGALPSGIVNTQHYFVKTTPTADTFTVTAEPGGDAQAAVGSQSGTHTVGLVIGIAGDQTFAIVAPGDNEEVRILGSKIVFLGEEYTVTGYQNELLTGAPYALVTFNRALVDSVVTWASLPTLKGAVPKTEPGSLAIRISLTRVTSHDLLEIGTGSYADTNYPNEIYGPPLNSFNASNETEERGVGRCFYVTTDQFGNFSVGPYFRVDQGTGTVTFAAAIALSNLDGIGFKRGVPVAEFSTDSSFADNATDTVPTENAARVYIERRLGLTHNGSIVPSDSLIPPTSGGFMALNGSLAMKGDMDMDDHKIKNVTDPTNPQDAVNLRSLTFTNLQEFTINDLQANDILTFTGDGNQAINTHIVGDISLNIDSTAHTLDAQINPGVILDADVNASAAIAQSKLSMNAATTRANATGIVQADRGLASFDSAVFDVTNGWVTVKDNGISLTDLPQAGANSVLGNSTTSTANITSVSFATVINNGLGIKKSNYTALGYLRRKNSLTANNDTGSGASDSYEMIDHSSTSTASTLVYRDTNGDFAGRIISASQFKVDSKVLADTTTSGGGGVVQLYGYNGNVAILMGDGSLATDKRNYYDNEGHIFRPQNGVGYAPIYASSAQVTTLTTGSSSTAGTITGNWSLSSGSQLRSTYADLAEYYEADKNYSVGTVLVFGGDKEVTQTGTQGDHRVAGVVSENAAYIMNSECPGDKVLIALQGRVPCKVVGKVRKGDLMVTSKVQGVAVSAGGDAKAGTVIGKALADYDSDHIGTIEVAVGRA